MYKIIKKQLQPYVVMVEGKTKIRQEGLKVVKPVEQLVSQPVEQPVLYSDLAEQENFSQPVEQPVSQPVGQPKERKQTGEIAALNRLIEELKQDKEYLQQQIERQNKLVDTLQERIAADGRRLENMQLLLDQQQKLTLVEKIPVSAAEEQEQEQIQPTEKKNFFTRLFNK